MYHKTMCRYGLKKMLGSIFFILFTITGLQAQTMLTTNTTTTLAPGEYYNNSSIDLVHDLTITPTGTQSYHFYISNGIAPLASSPSQSQNFIITYVPRISGITNTTLLNNKLTTELMENISYFDGVGRPMQNVQVMGSPLGNDMIQPIAYDQYARESVKYQPYAVSSATVSDGSYRSSGLTTQAAFYNPSSPGASNIATTLFPSTQTVFEFSPLNRVLEQGAPGDNWQIAGTSGTTNAGHTVKITYAGNDASSLTSGDGYWAKQYSVSIDGSNNRTLIDQGAYAVNQLAVTVTKNENWLSGKPGTVEEYKDKDGKTVLKRTFNLNGSTVEVLSTYYAYDNYGNLCYVLPPGANPDAGLTSVSNQTTLDNFCYQYQYDVNSRLVQKRIPGRGWDLIVYNNFDQVVATQDAVQYGINTWTFTKYDPQGRIIQSGTWDAGSALSRASVQSSVNSNTNLWENPASGGNVYSNNAWPTSSTTLLTMNYYDNYSSTYLSSGNALPAAYSGPSGYSTATTGLLTVTRTAVLNNPGDMLWAVHYYNDLGRVIQTYQQHYLGGSSSLSNNNYDQVTNTYDFTNEVTTTTRKHYTNVSSTATLQLTIANTYSYDHTGRKIQTHEQINTGTNVLLSQTDYNELGQPKTKHLHSTNNGGSFLQDETYAYNERGWLKTSSAPLFAMQLNYNDGTTPQYNGNISNQLWGTPGSLSNSYTYSYDYLNRLTAGTGSTSNTENSITYDEMGNIKSLNRYLAGSGPATDQLTYDYTGSSVDYQTAKRN